MLLHKCSHHTNNYQSNLLTLHIRLELVYSKQRIIRVIYWYLQHMWQCSSGQGEDLRRREQDGSKITHLTRSRDSTKKLRRYIHGHHLSYNLNFIYCTLCRYYLCYTVFRCSAAKTSVCLFSYNRQTNQM